MLISQPAAELIAKRRRASASISRLWSRPTTVQRFCRIRSRCDGARAGRDVEDRVARTCVDARDEETSPTWILTQRKQGRVPVVRRAERSEERPRGDGLGHDGESMLAAWN